MRQLFKNLLAFTLITALCSCHTIRVSTKNVFKTDDAEQAQKETIGERSSIERTKTSLVRIGVLLPLSGKYAKIGKTLQNASLMAMFEGNSKNVVLQFYDTEGTAEGARAAAELAISQNVGLIVGPLLKEEVNAIHSMTYGNGVDVITFSSDPTVVGKGVYTIATLASQQAEFITQYACSNGYKRFAILSQDNKTGDIISYAIKKAVDGCGAYITKAAFYDPKLDIFQPAVQSIVPKTIDELEKEREDELKRLEKLRPDVVAGKSIKIKNEETENWESVKWTEEQLDTYMEELKNKEIIRDPFEFDVLFVSDDGSKLRSLGAMFNYYDIPSEIKIIGTSQWAEAKPQQETSLLGGWFANLAQTEFKNWSKKYEKEFGEKPARIASQAYDAISLTISLVDNYGTIDSKTLTNPSGFNGIDGLFRLLPNGLSERGLQIMAVEKKGFSTLVQPLPQFQTMPETDEDVYREYYRMSPSLVTPAEEIPVEQTTEEYQDDNNNQNPEQKEEASQKVSTEKQVKNN